MRERFDGVAISPEFWMSETIINKYNEYTTHGSYVGSFILNAGGKDNYCVFPVVCSNCTNIFKYFHFNRHFQRTNLYLVNVILPHVVSSSVPPPSRGGAFMSLSWVVTKGAQSDISSKVSHFQPQKSFKKNYSDFSVSYTNDDFKLDLHFIAQMFLWLKYDWTPLY